MGIDLILPQEWVLVLGNWLDLGWVEFFLMKPILLLLLLLSILFLSLFMQSKLIRYPVELLEHSTTASKCGKQLPILTVDCTDDSSFFLPFPHSLQDIIWVKLVRHVSNRYIASNSEACLNQILLSVCVLIKHFKELSITTYSMRGMELHSGQLATMVL